MEKEKVLEIEFQKVWDNKWAWKITKNNLDFKNTRGEIVSEGVKIICSDKESLYLFDNWLVEWEILDNWNLVGSNQKTEIENFVKYINSTYGIQKRWRAQAGNLFYYITSDGDIESDYEDFSDENMDMYNLGNYFQTEEEAQKVIDSKEWQDFWAKVRAGEIGGDE